MKRLILLSLILLTIFGCEPYKKLAVGNDGPVYTFVDDSLWTIIEKDIREPVEKELRTPQIERIYHFEPIPLSDFKDYRASKNLMFITTLDRTDRTSRYIQRILPDTALRMIEKGERFLFPIKEKLAKRQIFIILAAPDDETLLTYIRNEGSSIYDALNKAFVERQFDEIYYKAEEKEITKSCLKNTGFLSGFPTVIRFWKKIPLSTSFNSAGPVLTAG